MMDEVMYLTYFLDIILFMLCIFVGRVTVNNKFNYKIPYTWWYLKSIFLTYNWRFSKRQIIQLVDIFFILCRLSQVITKNYIHQTLSFIYEDNQEHLFE